MSEKEKAGEVRLAGSDSESQSLGDPAFVAAPNGQGKLARKLKNRHIAMIRCAISSRAMGFFDWFSQYWRCHRNRYARSAFQRNRG